LGKQQVRRRASRRIAQELERIVHVCQKQDCLLFIPPQN
jgi:hypothetical protein